MKVQIKANKKSEPIDERGLDILINGINFNQHLSKFTLSIQKGYVNQCELVITPTDIEVDAEVVAYLQTKVNAND